MIPPVATVLALGLSACEDPYAAREREAARTATTTTAAAPAPPPVATTTGPKVPPPEAEPGEPPRTSGAGPQSSPATVLAEFGRRWANWDWRTASGQKGRLLPLATGRLAAYIRDQDDGALDVATLERSKKGYRGRVEGVVLKARTGERRPALVVIRQQEYEGRTPTTGGLSYTVYLAEVTRVAGGWAVSRWEGQE